MPESGELIHVPVYALAQRVVVDPKTGQKQYDGWYKLTAKDRPPCFALFPNENDVRLFMTSTSNLREQDWIRVPITKHERLISLLRFRKACGDENVCLDPAGSNGGMFPVYAITAILETLYEFTERQSMSEWQKWMTTVGGDLEKCIAGAKAGDKRAIDALRSNVATLLHPMADQMPPLNGKQAVVVPKSVLLEVAELLRQKCRETVCRLTEEAAEESQ